MASKISGTFGATGVSQELATNNFALSLSGTFTGTVDVERSFDGGATWVVAESHTAATEKSGSNGAVLPTRLNCSAYTSGTVTYAVQDDAP